MSKATKLYAYVIDVQMCHVYEAGSPLHTTPVTHPVKVRADTDSEAFDLAETKASLHPTWRNEYNFFESMKVKRKNLTGNRLPGRITLLKKGGLTPPKT